MFSSQSLKGYSSLKLDNYKQIGLKYHSLRVIIRKYRDNYFRRRGGGPPEKIRLTNQQKKGNSLSRACLCTCHKVPSVRDYIGIACFCTQGWACCTGPAACWGDSHTLSQTSSSFLTSHSNDRKKQLPMNK